ncbi:MAG: hypothetical protein QOE87_4407 [Gaiellales bacterium]|nr:hypothetical protein [Gaiellales bacterium]
MNDAVIRTLSPKPGEVIVYTSPGGMTDGELWSLGARFREAFPRNLVVMLREGTVDMRMVVFDEHELQAIARGIAASEGDDPGVAANLRREIEAELERRRVRADEGEIGA